MCNMKLWDNTMIYLFRYYYTGYLLGLLLRFAGELEANHVWKRSDVTLLRLHRLRRLSSCCTCWALGLIVCSVHVFCNRCRSWRLAFSRNHVSARAGFASRYLCHSKIWHNVCEILKLCMRICIHKIVSSLCHTYTHTKIFINFINFFV